MKLALYSLLPSKTHTPFGLKDTKCLCPRHLALPKCAPTFFANHRNGSYSPPVNRTGTCTFSTSSPALSQKISSFKCLKNTRLNTLNVSGKHSLNKMYFRFIKKTAGRFPHQRPPPAKVEILIVGVCVSDVVTRQVDDIADIFGVGEQPIHRSEMQAHR